MKLDWGVAKFNLMRPVLEEFCTIPQLQDFLRCAKKKKEDVRVSGSKAKLLDNIKAALSLGATEYSEVYALLCDSEESGDQNIFYFAPRTRKTLASIKNGDNLATALFGANWREERKFPQFNPVELGSDWSDFRIEEGQSKRGGVWVLKVYANIERRRLRNKGERHGDLEEEVYEYYPTREVLLARWDGRNEILEIRIPREETQKLRKQYIDALWSAIGSVVSRDDFNSVDLTPACRYFGKNAGNEPGKYRLGPLCSLDDQGGPLVVGPPPGHDDLISDGRRKQVVSLYEDHREITVTWLFEPERDGLEGEIKTIICKHGDNNLYLVSRTTAKAVRHVTNELLALSGKIS